MRSERRRRQFPCRASGPAAAVQFVFAGGRHPDNVTTQLTFLYTQHEHVSLLTSVSSGLTRVVRSHSQSDGPFAVLRSQASRRDAWALANGGPDSRPIAWQMGVGAQVGVRDGHQVRRSRRFRASRSVRPAADRRRRKLMSCASVSPVSQALPRMTQGSPCAAPFGGGQRATAAPPRSPHLATSAGPATAPPSSARSPGEVARRTTWPLACRRSPSPLRFGPAA